MPIKLLPQCALLACAVWAMQAPAAGLGVALGNPQLGQPLDFSVQVRTDPTETLAPECVSAEVLVGERRVPPAWVRAALEVQGPESARVRVVTTQAVDEPVVTVNVDVGCQSRVSRRYVLLVDLPVAQPAAPAFAAAPPEVPAAGPEGAPPGAAIGAAVAGTAPSTAPPAAPATRPAVAAPARPATARAEGAARRSTAARNEAPRRPRRVAIASPPPRAEPAPRLRLEAAEPPPRSAEAIAVEQAIEAVAQAASAARAAASAASAAQARVAALEREVGDLRGQARQQGEAAAELRRQLEASRGSTRWLMPLMLLVLALAALAMWLAWRMTQLQKQREAAWRQVVAPPPAVATASEITPSRQPTAPIPFVTSEMAPPQASPSRPRGGAPAWPPPAPTPRPVWPESIPPPAEARADAADDAQRTQPLSAMPGPTAAEAGAARDVTIEELIDLEQQAEFFVVLGQDEAAIDLLVEHLRHTGGGSPLPYLKLLEIYQRRSDREAYERMRSRFNQRFNAYAPEWGADLAAGRTMEDYAGVVPRLAQVWARPLDAMAELEALLFRRSRGELFELPAYREILFLYSVARDLLDREAADSGDVDLLLPMADGTEFGATTPRPYLGLESDAMPLARPGDDTPTSPLDLDLTGRRQSLFGELDPEARPPRG
jgi:hypothetical protein